MKIRINQKNGINPIYDDVRVYGNACIKVKSDILTIGLIGSRIMKK